MPWQKLGPGWWCRRQTCQVLCWWWCGWSWHRIGEPELRSAGDGGGETSAPSTCSIPSAWDPAFLFFIALVSLGDITGLLHLVFNVAAADADPPAIEATAPAVDAIAVATAAGAASGAAGWCKKLL